MASHRPSEAILQPLHIPSRLAQKGHQISFISTPRNLQRSVQVPHNLSHLINLITLPLPRVHHLPPDAESSMDVPHVKQQLLKVALDLLEPEIRSFLQTVKPKPDWIVYDYASHWLPQLAQELGISRAYFSLFTAAFMAFLGPPSALLSQQHGRATAEDYTVAPEWIPFPTNMAFRLHEMTKNMEKDADGNNYSSGTSDSIRFGLAIEGSDIIIFRSHIEFEPEWFDLIQKLYRKPIIPVGALPMEQHEIESNGDWEQIKQWLDTHGPNSTVYVALGTEAVLSNQEIEELALGLEQCGLPFLWVLNREHLRQTLPEGFLDRVRGRGMVRAKWTPQMKVLGHPAVGGFVTHCGWNSATEGLGFGRVLILLPMMNDQGLNARLLAEKEVGVEIPRNDQDGAFTREAVARTVRLAVVGEEGKAVRENARRMKELFGRESTSNCNTDAYIENLIRHMSKHM